MKLKVYTDLITAAVNSYGERVMRNVYRLLKVNPAVTGLRNSGEKFKEVSMQEQDYNTPDIGVCQGGKYEL